MIKENLEKIFNEIASGNNLGEPITLMGATKYVDAGRINEAISCSLTHIGENKAQEFRDKFPLYSPVYKHFIGRIQPNKLKYIVGKADCIDSVDSVTLAEKISDMATNLNITQNIMLEVNVGGEENKGGVSENEAISAYKSIKALKGVKIIGIMSMLPIESEEEVARHTEILRSIYDEVRKTDGNLKYLSVGISEDYKITIKHGANMIRLGTAIFGARNY